MFFEDILGHSHVKKFLQNSIANNRVAHAYLFSGPSGIGKTLMAEAFAAGLLCKTKPGIACGQCSVCKRILDKNYPDLITVNPLGEAIKIDQVRELQKKVQYRPYEAHKKICIINNAETMTRDAANCLLKVLEEPPEDTIFVLTAVNQYNLLPTIVSRCQLVQMGKVPTDEIEQMLVRQGNDIEKAKVIAALSDGIPEKALEMAGSGSAEETRKLVFDLIDLIEKGNTNELLKFAEELEKRSDLQSVIEQLLLWYRDSLIWVETKKEEFIVNQDKLFLLEGNKSREYYLDSIKEIMDANNKLKHNVNARLTLEVLLLKLASN